MASKGSKAGGKAGRKIGPPTRGPDDIGKAGSRGSKKGTGRGRSGAGGRGKSTLRGPSAV